MDEDNSLVRQGKEPMMEPVAPISEVRGIRSKEDQELVAKVPLGHLGPPAHPRTLQNPCRPTNIWKPQGQVRVCCSRCGPRAMSVARTSRVTAKARCHQKGQSAGFPRGPARHTSRRHRALNHLPGNIDGKLNKG